MSIPSLFLLKILSLVVNLLSYRFPCPNCCQVRNCNHGSHSERKRNSLHLWSPQLIISNSTCFLSCSISAPADLYFLIERETVAHNSSLVKAPDEVRQLGFYGGRFADEASFYVGSLSQNGRFHIWITLQADADLSDVYFYEVAIPS